MQEAYFDNIRCQIIKLLQNASKEVSIAMAWFTSIELFDELINCLNRGVTVRLVLLDNPINFMEYAPDFNEFIKTGGDLHIASYDVGLMHHKFCVIDGKIVVTGSYNWTYYAETRNVENILISDDGYVVTKFMHEFDRLLQDVPNIEVAPMYSLEALETMDNVDFTDINYEAEQIGRLYNRPVRKVVETKTQVFVSEIKATPESAFDIGVLAINNDDEFFEVIIHKGQSLPYTSCDHKLYFNSADNKELVTHIVGSETEEVGFVIREEMMDELTSGVVSDNLTLLYAMTLEVNGDLRMVVSCQETGRKKTLTMLNKKFVKYV